MENIYIDTSIFEANNFFESKRINEFFKLAEEGHINIIMPEITYHEVRNRIKKNVDYSFQKFIKSRNDTRVLRNIPSIQSRFEEIDLKIITDEMLDIFEDIIKRSRIKIIPYPSVNIGVVFNSYFNKVKPFSSGLKKDEFPDAFALNSLELWCEEDMATCLIFSKDKDLIYYESDVLKYVDYEEFLSDKLEEIEIKIHARRLEIIKIEFEENKEDFKAEILNWLNRELDEDSKYYDYSNYLEIHDLEILDLNVEIEDYKIISTSEKEIYLQSSVLISYEVQIEKDDENSGYYDGEDKNWYYFDTETQIIEKEKYIEVDFKFEIPEAGEDFAELIIDEINEGKSLKV